MKVSMINGKIYQPILARIWWWFEIRKLNRQARKLLKEAYDDLWRVQTSSH